MGAEGGVASKRAQPPGCDVVHRPGNVVMREQSRTADIAMAAKIHAVLEMRIEVPLMQGPAASLPKHWPAVPLQARHSHKHSPPPSN